MKALVALPHQKVRGTFWLLLVLLSSWASADEPEPTGAKAVYDALGPTFSLRGSYWSDDKRFTDAKNFGVGAAWLTLRPKEYQGFRTYFDGYVQSEEIGREPRTVWEAREAYVEHSLGPVDLRVGRQIIVWGRADKVNPTDTLTVKDFRLLMTDDEDQRLGLFAVQSSLNLGEYRFIVVWEPGFRFPGFPIPNLGSGVSLSNIDPDDPLRQLAFKLDHSGGSVDYSISYFHGIGHTPDLKVLSAGPAVELGLVFPRIQVLGADFATTSGSWGFRGETAYTWVSNSEPGDPLTQNNTLFTVLGVENSPFTDFSVNAQYLNRYVVGFEQFTASNPTQGALIAAESINTQQQVRMNHGVSLRPNYKLMNETLELEIAWVRWFTTGDQLLRPKVTYALSDHWKAIVGGELYSGASDTFFGRLHDASTVYAELRLGF